MKRVNPYIVEDLRGRDGMISYWSKDNYFCGCDSQFGVILQDFAQQCFGVFGEIFRKIEDALFDFIE